jgi:metal-dependent amidase/aminoacylase/carboxypeptidase family protein
VEIHGTLRTADPGLRVHLKDRIRAICDGVAAACGAKIELEFVSGYPALLNTPAEAERIVRIAGALLGSENACYRESPSMGGEDFSYFLEKAPGVFWHLGCAPAQPAPPLHSREFNPDERCLPIGAALQAALVLDRMGMLD